jgi:hypothetical protein
MNLSKRGILHDAAGAALVLVVRLLTAPLTLWEYDEVLFAQAVLNFDPANNHPHPPGYPLYVGLGKVAALITGEPFSALVALSILASVIGFIALRRAFVWYLGEEGLATAAALIFHLSAAMLVHGPLPMSDPVAIMFVCLALDAAAGLEREPTERRALLLGLYGSAAIGCRPQFTLLIVPMLLFVVPRLANRRQKIVSVSGFAVLSLLWITPLADELGGVPDLIAYERRQAAYVVAHDAAQSRGTISAAALVARFVSHPWGPKFIALPVLVLAIVGAVSMWRRREVGRAAPLWILGASALLFALLVMDPADAARYSLPALIAVALLTGAGLRTLRDSIHVAAAPALFTLILGAASIVYTRPILKARHSTPSPPAAAAAFARAHWPANTVILHDLSLRPHAEFFFPGQTTMLVEAGLKKYADHPETPMVIYGDGGAPSPSSTLFQWPDSDAYGKLTRNHYRLVSLEDLPAARRFVPLSGIFPIERAARGQAWRWLEPVAVLRLPALGKTTLALTMQLSADSPFERNIVSVAVDGRAAAQVVVPRVGGVTCTVPIPPWGATVSVESAQWFRPSEVVHNGDARRLSIQLVDLEQR